MIRIKELREEKKMNMRQTALALGIPYTTYISYEKGEREPNSEMLINLADYFNCSIDYLLGRSPERINEDFLDRLNEVDDDTLKIYGNLYEAKKAQAYKEDFLTVEQMFAETVTKHEIEHITKYRTLDGYGKKAVDDLLDTEAARCEEQRKAKYITFTKCSIHKASAGTGFDLNDPDMWKEIQVRDSEEARRADFAVEVDGDSMETTYQDGDIVYIVIDRDVPVGDVGLFTYENKGYIKERGDGCLISHNPKYDDIKPEYGNIECIGRVIGVAELAE